MKLTNPTDDELNATFAEKVAGLRGPDDYRSRELWEKLKNTPFVTSADAVLPWLEKAEWFNVSRPSNDGKGHFYCEVDLDSKNEVEAIAYADTFPKAICIALLRAHGVEVEFAL